MDTQALKAKARELKKNIVLLYLTFKHPKTPLLAKLLIFVVVSYALSPIDLIPDFIPVLGYIDDLILIPAGIFLALKLIPEDIILECNEKLDELPNINIKGIYAAIFIVLIWLITLYLIVGKIVVKIPHTDQLYTYIMLFAGGFLAAAISGAAGFGGALLLLPLLTKTLGTALAVPVLTVAQLIGNISRVYFGFKQIDWKPVKIFIFGAIPMAILGSFSFVAAPKELITRLVGLAIVTFALLKQFNVLKFQHNDKTMFFGGCITGLVSGLVGSAGPIGAALFLSLGLPPVSYIASEATTAVAMHITKIVIYQKYLDIGLRGFGIGLFVGIAMILGTWVGKKIIEKIPKEQFTKFVLVLLILIGLYMLIRG